MSPCLCNSLILKINMGSYLPLDQSWSGFKSRCQSAVCGCFPEKSAPTVGCSSVVSSCDGMGGVCGFCCRVWGGALAVGLHWELLHGVCGLLHRFTLLWNTDIVVRSDHASLLNTTESWHLTVRLAINMLSCVLHVVQPSENAYSNKKFMDK